MTKKDKKIDKTNLLFGLNFFGREESELLRGLWEKLLNSRKTTYIVTPNPEQVVQSREDKRFLKDLQAADIIIPDGVGIVLASHLLAFREKAAPLKKRITGADLASKLLEFARAHQLKVMIIGGRNYQSLGERGVIWLEAYQDVKNPTQAEEKKVVTALKKHRPDLVFVAFGAPAQEKWAVDHLELCQNSGVKILMVVGGAFDYISGNVARAPQVVRSLGGEWLYRLVQQPWRWRRQLRLLAFVGLVMSEFFSD